MFWHQGATTCFLNFIRCSHLCIQFKRRWGRRAHVDRVPSFSHTRVPWRDHDNAVHSLHLPAPTRRGGRTHKVPPPYPCEYTPATRQRPQGGRGRKSGGQPSHTGLKTSIESGGQPQIDTPRPARAANEGCWSTTAPRCRSQAACRLCRSRCCKCRNVVMS